MQTNQLSITNLVSTNTHLGNGHPAITSAFAILCAMGTQYRGTLFLGKLTLRLENNPLLVIHGIL